MSDTIDSTASTGHCGLRIHSAAPLTPRWLSATVVPAARQLTRQGQSVFLKQGWLRGPHVDLVDAGNGSAPIDWTEVDAAVDVAPVAADQRLAGQDYLDQARELGRLESVPPPYLPLQEHGVRRLLTARETQPRNPALRDVPEFVTVQAALTRPLIDSIDRIAATPSGATGEVAAAFAALGDTHHLGLAFGSYSFRSHAEAFFAWTKDRVDVRPKFEERRLRDAAVFREVVTAQLETGAARSSGRWPTAFAYSAGILDSAVRAGHLSVAVVEAMTGAEDFAPLDEHSAPPRHRQAVDSAFHRYVASTGVTDQPAPWFASFRILLNSFYAQLPMLSVSPMQRYYLCYAIAETLDEVVGETWQDRIAKVQQSITGEAS